MKTLLYFIVFAILVYQIHKINPKWLNLKENIIVDGQKLNPGIGLPFNLSEPPELKEASFTFRENIERTGVSKETLSLPLKKVHHISGMNFGIHGASKSSVAVDPWGIVVPTDTAWLYHFGHDYKLQWKFFISESARGIHGTPVLTENMVYLGGYNGRIYALERATGKPIWVYKVGGALGASPMLYKDHLYIAVERTDVVDGYLVKLDAKTGQLIWKTKDIGEQPHSSPAMASQVGLLFFGANNERFYSIKDRDGSVNWEYKANGQIKGTPAVTESCVLFSDWGSRLSCMRPSSGTVKWSIDIKEKSQSSPTVVEEIDRVVVSSNNGNIWGVKLSDGEVVWHHQVHSPLMMGSGTAFKNQQSKTWQIITACGLKQVCVYDMLTGKELQSIEVSGLVNSVPSIYGGKVFLSTVKNGVDILESSELIH